jgi:hypothetical protein
MQIYRLAARTFGYDMVVQDKTTRIPSKLQEQFVSNFQISMAFISIYLLLNRNIIHWLSFPFICCRRLVDKLWVKSPKVIKTCHSGKQTMGEESSYKLDVHPLNDMVYVYYNRKLWVKQIDKSPDTEAISLDATNTMSPWRVKTERTIIEEASKWLEQNDNVLEEGESKEDVQLLVETHLEEEIKSASQPLPPQRQTAKRRHLTSTSTLARTPSTLALAVAPSTSSSTTTPTPTASKGRAVTFARKRGRGNR